MKTLLSIREILLLSWKEIQERLGPLFFLAVMLPFSMWLLNGLFVGFDPLQLKNQTLPLSSQILVSLCSSFVSLYLTGTLLLFISKQTPTVSEALFLSLRKLPRFFFGLFIYGIILVLMSTLFVLLLVGCFLAVEVSHGLSMILAVLTLPLFIVGLILSVVYFIFLPYTLVLTDKPLFNCFSHSYRLVKNHFWNTVGFLCVLALLAVGVVLVSYILLGIVGFIGWILLPVSRYAFPVFALLPSAFIMLLNQVALFILYQNRSNVLLETSTDQNPSH